MKYKYLVVESNFGVATEDQNKQLNGFDTTIPGKPAVHTPGLGEQGWELVSVLHGKSSTGQDRQFLYFKQAA
jgi:hypothetical protein